jgi:D-amino-acid dehydrogenase
VVSGEVVVVGGGAIGVCCALELAERGCRVTLVERGEKLASGASSGNAGLICPSHSTPIANPDSVRTALRSTLTPDAPFSIRLRPSLASWTTRFVAASTSARAAAGTRLIQRLSVASLELHAELFGRGADTGFERRGVLTVYETGSAFAAAGKRALAGSFAAQVLGRDETRELEPAVRGEIAGSVYFPDEAHCDPLGFVRAVGAAAAEAGADIRTGSEVGALRRSKDGLVLDTATGVIQAETVVLAAGAWSSRLASPLGICLPLVGGKGYHLDLERAPGDPHVPISFEEAHVIATPLPDRLRLSGTLELAAGLDTSINRPRLEAIRSAAARLLGLRERKELEVWSGLRPCTPDGLPVIGRPSGIEPLVLATGHARKGLSLAPITGRLVAEFVVGEKPSIDLEPFTPDRFRPLLRSLRP